MSKETTMEKELKTNTDKPMEWDEAEKEVTKVMEATCESIIGEDGLTVWDFATLRDALIDSRLKAIQATREETVEEVRSRVKRYHIQFENTEDPEVNAERRKYNDEVSELINSVLNDILDSLTNKSE